MSVDTPLLEENELEGDNNILEEEALNSLLNKNLEKFEELIKLPQINLQRRYDSCNNFTLLQISCMHPNRGPFVKALLNFVQPNIEDGITEPIHTAATYGQNESLNELVLDTRTNISAVDHTGSTALILVCKHVTEDRFDNYLQCLTLLINRMPPGDLNICDNNGYTAFHVLVRNPEINFKRNKFPSNASLLTVGSEDSLGSGEIINDKNDNKDARYKLTKVMLEMCKNDLNVHSKANGRLASDDLELYFPDLKRFIFSKDLDHKHKVLINAVKERRINFLGMLLKQLDDEGHTVYNVNYRFGYPHSTTCLGYACTHGLGAECIKVLLNANADPNVLIHPDMKTLVHLVCERGHYNELRALLDHETCPDINSVDRYGNTALHYILDTPRLRKVNLGDKKCLEILLEQESLNVNIINNSGLTPIMLGIKHNNCKFLKKIIKIKGSQIRWDIQYNGESQRSMCEKFPALLKLIPSGNDISEVDNGSSSIDDQEITSSMLFNCLRRDERRFVELIKKFDGNVSTVSSNVSKDSSESYTLLQRASSLGLSDAVTALLDAKADPNYTFGVKGSPPAVIAAENQHYHVLKIFLENRRNGFDVNATDSKGNTALHYAMRASSISNLDIVIQLLHCGSDVEKRNIVGKPPISKMQLESLLDQCVQTNHRYPFEDEYELIFDYRLIATSNPNPQMDSFTKVEYKNPNDCVIDVNKYQSDISSDELRSEMQFLLRMSKSVELSFLLDHPVISTFLRLKWNRVKHLLYANIVLYITFLVVLNIFIVHCAYPQSHNLEKKISEDPNYLLKKSQIKNHMVILLVVILLFWFVIFLREGLQIILKKKQYIINWENCLQCIFLTSSLITVLIPFTNPNYYLQRVFNVVTILLSWTNLLILLGQTTFFTKHVEMLKLVIKNYLLPLLCYCSFVVAFGLSFHTLYRGNPKNPLPVHEDQNDFNFWHRSIVKALVMMTGELGFDSFPKDSPFAMILFLIFVLLETIVVINLLAGLASRGTEEIENAAARLELITRVRVITRIELPLIAMHKMFGRLLPKCLRNYLRRSVIFAGVPLENQRGTIRPNQSTHLLLGEDPIIVLKASTLECATRIISKRTEKEVENEKNTRKPTLDDYSLPELHEMIRRKSVRQRHTTQVL